MNLFRALGDPNGIYATVRTRQLHQRHLSGLQEKLLQTVN